MDFAVNWFDMGTNGKGIDDGSVFGKREVIKVSAFDGDFGVMSIMMFGKEGENGVKFYSESVGMMFGGNVKN